MPSSHDTPACFVATIDLALADKLRQELEEQGFTLSKPPYTLFAAVKKGVSCTLYASGKLTVQGKDKGDFIAFYLEPEILKTLAYTYPEKTETDLTTRIGIDEAGKGDFFGPLCIAGVQADPEKIEKLLALKVRDSKKISDASILKMSDQIKRLCPHSLVLLFPEKYNALYANFQNLNRLLAWAHATAISELVEKTGCRTVIIDQFAKEDLVKNAIERKKIEIELSQRTHAESDPVVAAASILARAAFLEGLKKLEHFLKTSLPKGASEKVVEVGRVLVLKYGEKILESVAKLHFKTKAVILHEP